MAFDSFSAFLQMGTHGPYVWSAYLIVLLSLVGMHMMTNIRHQRLKAKLAQLKQEAN